MNIIKLSIIIPCYNEEKNIILLVNEIKKVFLKRADIEVLLVDNGSKDNSKKIIEKAIENSNNIKIVVVPKNKGYGHGILTGLKEAKGEVLSWTHADLQTDIGDVLLGYNVYLKMVKENNSSENILIKGKRKNRNKLDELFTFGMQIIASVLLKLKLDDINAQPKIFSRDFYECIKNGAPNDFSLDLYFLYKALKMGLIYDFPVYFNQRLHGEAKGGGTLQGKWKLIKRTLKYMRELKRELQIKK